MLFLLGEEAEASPSIANTLWRVWTMFTRSAITPLEVNGFGWNLGMPGHVRQNDTDFTLLQEELNAPIFRPLRPNFAIGPL